MGEHLLETGDVDRVSLGLNKLGALGVLIEGDIIVVDLSENQGDFGAASFDRWVLRKYTSVGFNFLNVFDGRLLLKDVLHVVFEIEFQQLLVQFGDRVEDVEVGEDAFFLGDDLLGSGGLYELAILEPVAAVLLSDLLDFPGVGCLVRHSFQLSAEAGAGGSQVLEGDQRVLPVAAVIPPDRADHVVEIPGDSVDEVVIALENRRECPYAQLVAEVGALRNLLVEGLPHGVHATLGSPEELVSRLPQEGEVVEFVVKGAVEVLLEQLNVDNEVHVDQLEELAVSHDLVITDVAVHIHFVVPQIDVQVRAGVAEHAEERLVQLAEAPVGTVLSPLDSLVKPVKLEKFELQLGGLANFLLSERK